MKTPKWLKNLVDFHREIHAIIAVHTNFVLNGGMSWNSYIIVFIYAVISGLLGIAAIAAVVSLPMYLWYLMPGHVRSTLVGVASLIGLPAAIVWAFIAVRASWRKTHPPSSLSLGKQILKGTGFGVLVLLGATAIFIITAFLLVAASQLFGPH